jgi:hypothetical protein
MLVYVMETDQDAFITACETALLELQEDEDICDEIRSEMAEELRATFDNDSEYNANDLVYGDLCLDVTYEADDNFPYAAWIYLSDEM